jgi:hypothetical protein
MLIYRLAYCFQFILKKIIYILENDINSMQEFIGDQINCETFKLKETVKYLFLIKSKLII